MKMASGLVFFCLFLTVSVSYERQVVLALISPYDTSVYSLRTSKYLLLKDFPSRDPREHGSSVDHLNRKSTLQSKNGVIQNTRLIMNTETWESSAKDCVLDNLVISSVQFGDTEVGSWKVSTYGDRVWCRHRYMAPGFRFGFPPIFSM